eukprot:jgi/Bigna1/132654/aug1.18_g7362
MFKMHLTVTCFVLRDVIPKLAVIMRVPETAAAAEAAAANPRTNSIRKTWRATSRGKITKHTYAITIDARTMFAAFVKKKGTGKQFSILRCKMLQTSKTEQKELSIKFEADGKSPSWKKVLVFDSKRDRAIYRSDDFAEVFRLIMMAGEKVVMLR